MLKSYTSEKINQIFQKEAPIRQVGQRKLIPKDVEKLHRMSHDPRTTNRIFLVSRLLPLTPAREFSVIASAFSASDVKSHKMKYSVGRLDDK